MEFSATVAGHSYVKRLEAEFQNGVYPNNFGLQEFQVQFVHRGGAHINDLKQMLHSIVANHPQVVLLQIGGNDFSGRPDSDHVHVTEGIIELSKQIRTCPGVKVVYISKLFYRKLNKRYLPTQRHVQRYNDKVDIVNSSMDKEVPALRTKNIFIRNHKGRELLKDKILAPDGTHLNELGMRKFYRSIRGALITSKQVLAGQ